MGRYEEAVWESEASAPTLYDRRGGTYHPYVPDTLNGAELHLSMEAAAACERAAIALSELDARARYTATAESLSRILLRSEAMSSSRIEGLEMNARRLFELEALDELGVSHRTGSAEAEVLGNIGALYEAVESETHKTELTVAGICAMHRALLEHTQLVEYGGKLRQAQNWIGGSWYNPLGARYVPPRPELVPALMEDLVAFANGSPLPTTAVAALAHAQIETIHPFADGNGRTGRALIHTILWRRGLVTRTVVPVSLVLLTLREQYYDALAAYRSNSDAADAPAQDEVASQWVEFFCYALELACQRALGFEERMAAVCALWQEELHPRADSATALLLDALPGNPVVSVQSAMRLTGRSYPAARAAVRALEEAGVLFQSSRNRKSGLFAAREVLDEITYYERALATVSGDTRSERPARHVPQRPRPA